MNRAVLILALISLYGISCERHSWEETKGLHHHGTGGGHNDGEAAEHESAGGQEHGTSHEAGQPAAPEAKH